MHPHARRTKHPGPKPRERLVWEDPEEATRQAMLQFIDPYERDPDLGPPGRRWHAAEIRLKSNQDLQKLWIVLLKERNMLHTTRLQHKKQKTKMPHMERIQNVRKSMAMIKVVLGERERMKIERDTQLQAESERKKALAQLDLEASELWPPWVPGHPRELPLAAKGHNFSLVLRTADGLPPSTRPPSDAFAFTFSRAGEPLPPESVHVRTTVRPPAPTRPNELAYSCHIHMRGFALPKALFLASETEIGPPVEVEMSCELYGQPLGKPVVVHVQPSKRTRRHAAMKGINIKMSAELKARAEAAGRQL